MPVSYDLFPTNIVGPELGSTRKVEPKIKKTEFGDGYSQESPDGLNHMLGVWSVSWPTLTLEEFTAIQSFITSHNGCDTFEWYAPNGGLYLVKCRSWTEGRPYAGLYSFEAEFDEVPL